MSGFLGAKKRHNAATIGHHTAGIRMGIAGARSRGVGSGMTGIAGSIDRGTMIVVTGSDRQPSTSRAMLVHRIFPELCG